MHNNTEKLPFDSQTFLKNLTTRPGIYRMFDLKGDLIYVGKAKNLKNRVSSYYKTQFASPKQTVMMAKVTHIEVTVTQSESEALLLECQYIKRHKPRYNICLRDDKTFPFIHISTHHDYPQISLHRGAKKAPGKYFGPYPNAVAAKECLKLLQKLFPIRQCDDTVFNYRTRPCLQYQIGRCTAPCVGFIDKPNYAIDVNLTLLFLEGKNAQLIDNLIIKMERAAAQLEYEIAATIRDQISRIRPLLEKQCVHGEKGNVDIIACANQHNIACIQVYFIRQGQQLGQNSYYPKMHDAHSPAQVMHAFISQFYTNKHIPYEIIVSHEPDELALLTEVLTLEAEHTVSLVTKVRGERNKWLAMAQTNVEHALHAKLSEKASIHQRLQSLANALKLTMLPQRFECVDISHTQGMQTVASCVVFDQEGPVKSAYRRFNITDITPGDDYAAMYQAVSRRFKRLQDSNTLTPDILFIDGGSGQINAAQKALEELSINNVMIVGVSKGPERKAGMEKLLLVNEKEPIDIKNEPGGLLLIQHIRDEAHRFAITAHRQRRNNAQKKSVLEGIVGLGSKRRQKLLKQFGGLQGVSQASIDALCSLNGISRPLSQRIYEQFHHQDGH